MTKIRNLEEAGDAFEPFQKASRTGALSKRRAQAIGTLEQEVDTLKVRNDLLSRKLLAVGNLLKRAIHWAPQSFRDEVERVKEALDAVEEVHP